MSASLTPIPIGRPFRRLKLLCMGRSEAIIPWLDERGLTWPLFCSLVILCGCGLYGVSVGLWRSSLQSLFTGIKFPLLIFLTCAGNGILNGMLGQVLGSSLSFRKTALLVLFSFTVAAVILGAFSTLALFVLWCTPPLTEGSGGHSITLLTHVFLIAYAGVMANYRLLQLLDRLCPTRTIARMVLLAWLGGNLLLGAQLSWVLRPFIGSPKLPVEFLRDDPLNGNFFEAVWSAFRTLFLS